MPKHGTYTENPNTTIMEITTDLNVLLANSHLCAYIFNILEDSDAVSILAIWKLNKDIRGSVHRALPHREQRVRVLELCQVQGGPTSSTLAVFKWSWENFRFFPQFAIPNWNLEIAVNRGGDYSIIEHVVKDESVDLGLLVPRIVANDRVDIFKKFPLKITKPFFSQALFGFALEIVKYLVSEGVSLDPYKKLNLCQRAEELGDLEMVEYAISQGFVQASVHGKAAATKNNVAQLQFFLNNGIDFLHSTVFLCAVRAGSLDVLKFCLDQGLGGPTILQILIDAIALLQINIVRWMLERPDFVNFLAYHSFGLQNIAARVFARLREYPNIPPDFEEKSSQILELIGSR